MLSGILPRPGLAFQSFDFVWFFRTTAGAEQHPGDRTGETALWTVSHLSEREALFDRSDLLAATGRDRNGKAQEGSMRRWQIRPRKRRDFPAAGV